MGNGVAMDKLRKAQRVVLFGIICDTSTTTEQKVDRIAALSRPVDSMERVKEVVCQAHMAGQLNAGCAEPSWSEAHAHYTYKAQPALSDSPPKGCGECDGSGWKEGIVRCIECNSDGSKKRTPAEQDSTGEAQITQWACGGCGATVNGRQNYCPECGGTLTKGDKDCNGHCNCQQRGQ